MSNASYPTNHDRILHEIEGLRSRIRSLELALNNGRNPSITIEDLNVAGPITFEPIIGRAKREFELGGGNRIVQRRINEALFCRCGRRLEQTSILRCQRCSQLVCQECAILYHGKVFCAWCFKGIHDLTKSDYKILLCIASGISDENDIFLISGVPPERVRRRISKFMDVYVSDKATCFKEFFFSVTRLTDAGADALAAYERIFGMDYDSVFVKQKIRGFIRDQRIREADKSN